MKYQYETVGDEYSFQTFLKDLFNLIYDTNSFEEYRTRGAFQFGVDVYSPVLKIAVQAKKKDINKCTRKVLEKQLIKDIHDTSELLANFPHPVEQVFIASTTPKYSKVQDEALKKSTASLQFTFFSWDDIQPEITKFQALRNKYYPHLTTHIYPKELVAIPHIDITSVVGREEDAAQLDNLLLHNRVVCVQSIGGVGKTTFVKSYYQSRMDKYDHVLWQDYALDYRKGIAANESLIGNLGLSYNQDDSDEKRYQGIINSLTKLAGKCLLVYDNLKHEKSVSIENEIQKLLANKDITILFTSREPFSQFIGYPLEAIKPEFAKDLFLKHCSKQIDLKNLDTLLGILHCNALLTEVVAKTIHNGYGLSIEKMIEILKEGDVEERIRIEVDHYSNNELASGTLYRHLLKIVNFDTLESIYEQYIVSLLSAAPANDLPIEEIFSIFLYSESEPDKVINAINSLHKKGIITRNDDHIKMHRMVQDVVRMEISNYVIFIGILNSIIRTIRKANFSFSNKGYRITMYAESLLEKIRGTKTDGITQPLTVLKNNLYLMYRYLGDDIKADAIAIELMDALNSGEYKMSELHVTLTHNIGTHYLQEGDLEQAEKLLKEAIELNGEDLNITVLYSHHHLLETYLIQNRLPEAIQCAAKAMKTFERFPEDEYDDALANLASQFATVNMLAGNTNHAVFHITVAIKLYRGYNRERRNEGIMAMTYAKAASIFSSVENHECAIQFALHAIDYQQKLTLENDTTLKYYYRLASEIYARSGDKDNSDKCLKLSV